MSEVTHIGGRLRDAAAEDPADRPAMKPESEYPTKIPRVPATFVETPSGPAWEYRWRGIRSYRGGSQALPVLVHHDRAILLVEAVPDPAA